MKTVLTQSPSFNLLQAKKAVIAWRYKLVWAIFMAYLSLEALALLVKMEANDTLPFLKNLHIFFFLAIGICILFCEIIYKRVQNSYLERLIPEPDWIKYLMVFLEVSLPSFLIFGGGFSYPIGKVLDAISPISHIPFLLISVHYMRLRFCLFGGIIIAVERGLIFLYAYCQPDHGGLLEAWMFYFWHQVDIFATALVIGVIARVTSYMIEAAIRFSEEKNNVKDILGRFVSKDVAEKLFTLPINPKPDRVNACVLFLDIRDFTKLSSSISPEETVAFLNRIFKFSVERIEQEGGIVNKFLGDGLMAIFGTPVPHATPVSASTRASKAIFQDLDNFNRERKGAPVKLGIGIHFGSVVAGIIGTSERKEYTVIGDIVNTASRIETLNKEFQSRMLISQGAWQTLKEEERVGFTPLPPTHVKGKEESIQVYMETTT